MSAAPLLLLGLLQVTVPPDSVIRQLTVEQDCGAQSVMLAGSAPGYAAVTGLLDGLIHRLSEGTVGRPG